MPQNSFFRFKKWTDTTGHNLYQDENVQLVSCIFSSAWPKSKIQLKRQKANLGHARNGWNRRIFVYFFSSFVWKIKSASGCRIIQDFARLRAVPAKTAFDQIQTNMSKPPKKVDIDTLASGKTNYHSKIKEMLCIPN